MKLSRKEVLRKTGELYTLSHLINLSSHLTDTPDFYWDRDELEKLYRQALHYFNIQSRTRVRTFSTRWCSLYDCVLFSCYMFHLQVMNHKLTHCIDLVDLLRDHLNTKHEVRLEWMIIILILVEVSCQC